MKGSVGSVISVRRASAVGTIVRVSTRMVAGIARSPRVIAVIVVVPPGVVRDVGTVVVDDSAAATTAEDCCKRAISYESQL